MDCLMAEHNEQNIHSRIGTSDNRRFPDIYDSGYNANCAPAIGKFFSLRESPPAQHRPGTRTSSTDCHVFLVGCLFGSLVVWLFGWLLVGSLLGGWVVVGCGWLGLRVGWFCLFLVMLVVLCVCLLAVPRI